MRNVRLFTALALLSVPVVGSATDAFACLDRSYVVDTVVGSYDQKYDADEAPGKGFDARGADFLTDNSRWGTITVQSEDEDMCWAGGYIRSSRPWTASWLEHKATSDDDDPSRNSAAVELYSPQGTVAGVICFNVHDCVRTTDATDWRIEHLWASYTRDDAVENDGLSSGSIHDSLFDGTYAFFSSRPRTGDTGPNGSDSIVDIDKALVRLQAQPYPYKWETRPAIDSEGNPYEGEGIPYGHGNLFKFESNDMPGRNVHFRLRDSVFVSTYDIRPKLLDLPPSALIEECSNVTVVWLGAGDYPGALPDGEFAGCVTVVTGDAGRELWKEKVADWHDRHPDVGADRKPEHPGEIVFPYSF